MEILDDVHHSVDFLILLYIIVVMTKFPLMGQVIDMYLYLFRPLFFCGQWFL